MNDQRFFDLAMKVASGQATAAERAELDARVASEPALKAELVRLQEEVRLVKEVLPLVSAIESPKESAGDSSVQQTTRSGTKHQTEGDSIFDTARKESAPASTFPSYARERLQTKVRETYGQNVNARPASAWRWWLGLATATAAIVILLVAIRPTEPQWVVQVAMLDTAGNTRGGENPEIKALEAAWRDVSPRQFSEQTKAAEWEKDLPASLGPTVFKVIYDRTAAEVRVVGRVKGKPISKSFVVENDLAASLKQARDFIDSARTQ